MITYYGAQLLIARGVFVLAKKQQSDDDNGTNVATANATASTDDVSNNKSMTLLKGLKQQREGGKKQK